MLLFFVADLYSWLRWPGQHDKIGQSIIGVLVMASVPAALVFPAYFTQRRSRWIVNKSGVDVFVGKSLRVHLPWGRVKKISIMPNSILLRGQDEGRFKLYWTTRSESRKLQERWRQHAYV